MSMETLQTLNTQTLIGFTDKRGSAWHYRAEQQGEQSNHYPGAVPVADVRRRLLDWTAVEGEVRATALTDTGVLSVVDPTRKAVMRSDTGAVLGVFKAGYRIHQYDQWLVSNVETILDADVAIGSAGLLKGGAVAWVQVELADTIGTPAGVAFRPFLTAATSMDGSLATTYQSGAQVVVCDNTLSAALGERDAARVKVRHSTNSLKRIASVRDALGVIHAVGDAFSAAVADLTAREVSGDQWRAFLFAWAPDNPQATARVRNAAARKREQLARLWRHDTRVSPWAGTAYGVVQAVNTWTHHHQAVRGASRAERNAERAITGAIDVLDTGTLDLLERVA